MTTLQDNATRSLQLVYGSTNTTYSSPSTFALQLPAAGYRAVRDEVALKSLTMQYSWPNITAAKGNNSFSYWWPGDNTTYTVVLGDGIWAFADIRSYFQSVMLARGHYLLDSTSAPVYYIDFVVNPVLYCLTLTCTPLPATLPTGWTNPASVNLTTAANRCPRFIVTSAASATLFGFPVASYPAVTQTSLYQVNSGIPQISDVSAINVLCSIVDSSGISLNTQVLATFVLPSTQTAGSLFQIEPYSPDWQPIYQQLQTNNIRISLVDQLMRPITLLDPAGFVLVLNIRRRH